MNNKNKDQTDIVWYGGIFLLALFLRGFLLGNTPLTDGEAVWALQAWKLAELQAPLSGAEVGYLSVTGMLFSLLQSTNFLARLWPALLGSFLVWVPYFLRNRLGRLAAIAAAVGLALDPGLVTASRLVGGPVPALVMLIFSAVFFDQKRFSWFLFTMGLSVFSGTSVWLGMLLGMLTLLLVNSLDIVQVGPYLRDRIGALQAWARDRYQTNSASIAVPLLAAAALGSCFFQCLSGLSAWTNGLVEFLSSWSAGSQGTLSTLLILLLFTSPFALFLGGAEMVRSWVKADRVSNFISLWFGVSLILLLAYPGRRSVDLVWVMVPLWLVAGKAVSRFPWKMERPWIVWSFGGFVIALLTLNWLLFIGMVYRLQDQRALLERGGVVIASLLLMGLSSLIISYEWSWPTAKRGLQLGFSAGLVLYGLSSLVLGAYIRAGDPRSLWISSPGVGEYRWMKEQLEEVSIAISGRRDDLDGAVIEGNPGLEWELRGFAGIKFIPESQEPVLSPIVITNRGNIYPELESIYWGQDFVSATRPAWEGILPADWSQWVAFREGPLLEERMILWVREDSLPWVAAGRD